MDEIQFAGFKVAKNYAHPEQGYFIAWNERAHTLYGDTIDHVISNIIDYHQRHETGVDMSGTYRDQVVAKATEPWSKTWQWIDGNKMMCGYYDTFEAATCAIDDYFREQQKRHAE